MLSNSANGQHASFMNISNPQTHPFFSARINPGAVSQGRKHGKHWAHFVGMTIALLFSFFLMFHTFSYDGKRQELQIASKAWSDFGAHIPLIRSFSSGENLNRFMQGKAVESPLFPGEPIRYHYGFYLLVGALERLGVRIDWALNVPSALGFFALIVGIFALAWHTFHRVDVAALSVLFFLFNGSLAFLPFFASHPLSPTLLTDILTNTRFAAFGPWDGGDITAFWTLNIYTNQRHLALSYALIIGIIFLLHTRRMRSIHVSALVCAFSLLLFVNFAAAGIAFIFCASYFLAEQRTRLPLLIAAAFTIPPFLYLLRTANLSGAVSWHPGYLAKPPLTLPSFLSFWLQNIGLHAFLIPLGIILSPRHVRRRFLPALLVLFVLPNLFRLSPDIINNHKFFNFFLLIGAMFSAFAVSSIVRGAARAGKPAQILASIMLIVTLTFSGILDFFPIINDAKGSVRDVGADATARFIAGATNPADTVANSTWFYHPASLAGRPILSGYTYFTWSYGYNQEKREAILRRIYQAANRKEACVLLMAHRVALVELSPKPESYLSVNAALWDTLVPAYTDPETGRKLYKSEDLCR